GDPAVGRARVGPPDRDDRRVLEHDDAVPDQPVLVPVEADDVSALDQCPHSPSLLAAPWAPALMPECLPAPGTPPGSPSQLPARPRRGRRRASVPAPGPRCDAAGR